MFTFLALILFRFAGISSPALEYRRSEGTEVAGAHRYLRANYIAKSG